MQSVIVARARRVSRCSEARFATAGGPRNTVVLCQTERRDDSAAGCHRRIDPLQETDCDLLYTALVSVVDWLWTPNDVRDVRVLAFGGVRLLRTLILTLLTTRDLVTFAVLPLSLLAQLLESRSRFHEWIPCGIARGGTVCVLVRMRVEIMRLSSG